MPHGVLRTLRGALTEPPRVKSPKPSPMPGDDQHVGQRECSHRADDDPPSRLCRNSVTAHGHYPLHLAVVCVWETVY